MSFLENPFSVLHYEDGDTNDAEETERNPVVKGKNNNQQKQQESSDQSRLASVPYRHGRPANGEMGSGSENGNGFYRFDNGAPETYNGQSNGGKDDNGQHEINDQYGYEQGNGYDNLNDQPPPDGDYSSEGCWNFVGERRGGTLRRRIGSWRINSSKLGGLNEVEGEKFFPKPKQYVKNSDDKNVKIEGEEETTEQITRRNQSSELIKKVQRNMTLKEYEELLIQKRKASEAINHAEDETTLEKPEQCLDKSISMDFFVKLFKRRDDHTVDKNPVGYSRDIQSGGQRDQFDIEGCSDIVPNAPFDINIQDHEQFPCLNVVIKT